MVLLRWQLHPPLYLGRYCNCEHIKMQTQFSLNFVYCAYLYVYFGVRSEDIVTVKLEYVVTIEVLAARSL